MPAKKIRLGDLLINSGSISKEQLEQALTEQRESGGKLGDVLVKLEFITQTEFAKILSQQLSIPFIDLKHYTFKPEVIQKLPERLARRYRAILLDIVEGSYLVGMADPTDLIAFDELSNLLNTPIKSAVVLEDDLVSVFDTVYRKTGEITSFAQALKEEIASEEPEEAEEQNISANAAPVVKLLDSIFEDAVQMGASDVHIEPDEKCLHIRQRVDGVLQEHTIPGKEIMAALVLRMKLIANMNISEKRIPQDGRFAMMVKGKKVDTRVAIMPTHYGEAVVLRLLDQSKGLLKLEQLGIPEHMLSRIKTLIRKPNGMILITGPTGSGKTTTLYGMLNELNSVEKKIITIEDPVEYILPRVNQVQVKPDIDLTFSSVLRAAVRHDPDIIMVGEMRDEETASIGLRAAMTGHLVFSTLHTNDSIGCAVRLIDMGAEGFLVASALRGIIAQRLVRRICEGCKTSYTPSEQEQIWISEFTNSQASKFTFHQGAGCSHCNKTGFHGRIGVYEYLEMNKQLADALRADDTSLFVKLARDSKGFVSLTGAAFEAATKGQTALSEVFKISGELE